MFILIEHDKVEMLNKYMSGFSRHFKIKLLHTEFCVSTLKFWSFSQVVSSKINHNYNKHLKFFRFIMKYIFFYVTLFLIKLF